MLQILDVINENFLMHVGSLTFRMNFGILNFWADLKALFSLVRAFLDIENL